MSDNIMTIDALRDEVASQLARITVIVVNSSSPVVQELILAQRHLEDARMRLGVALAYQNGDNPWSNTPKKPESSEEK